MIINISGFRRMLFGGPDPDMGDPKVRERYDSCVGAGRRFAERFGLVRAGGAYIRFTDAHRRGVFLLVFSVMLFFTCVMIGRFATSVAVTPTVRSGSVVVRQDSVVRTLLKNKQEKLRRYEQD